MDNWFSDPFSLPQLISWVLLLGSMPLALSGFYSLHKSGQPDQSLADPTRLGFEKTTQLVTSGIYRYIRHPLYASLLCLTWGVFLKELSLPSTMLALITTLLLYATARVEEIENIQLFGQEYRDYMQQTKMFIPLIF